MVITQGDTATLTLTARDRDTHALFDLTAASFQTEILSAGGSPKVFSNTQHTANPDQVNNKGKFTLTLSSADTLALKVGTSLEVITKVTQGGSIITFRGRILDVLPNRPQG